MDKTHPNAADWNWNIKDSKFYRNPGDFLKMGEQVRALRRVWDLPGNEDPGPIRAEVGDIGYVVHQQEGCWPTVMFPKGATCVTDFEVERIAGPRKNSWCENKNTPVGFCDVDADSGILCGECQRFVHEFKKG